MNSAHDRNHLTLQQGLHHRTCSPGFEGKFAASFKPSEFSGGLASVPFATATNDNGTAEASSSGHVHSGAIEELNAPEESEVRGSRDSEYDNKNGSKISSDYNQNGQHGFGDDHLAPWSSDMQVHDGNNDDAYIAENHHSGDFGENEEEGPGYDYLADHEQYQSKSSGVDSVSDNDDSLSSGEDLEDDDTAAQTSEGGDYQQDGDTDQDEVHSEEEQSQSDLGDVDDLGNEDYSGNEEEGLFTSGEDPEDNDFTAQTYGGEAQYGCEDHQRDHGTRYDEVYSEEEQLQSDLGNEDDWYEDDVEAVDGEGEYEDQGTYYAEHGYEPDGYDEFC